MTIDEAMNLLELTDRRRFHEWLNAAGLVGRGTHTNGGILTDAAERLVRGSGAPHVQSPAPQPNPVVDERADVRYRTLVQELIEARQEIEQTRVELCHARQELQRLTVYVHGADELLGHLCADVADLQANPVAVTSPSLLMRAVTWLKRPAASAVRDVVRQVPEFAATEVYYGSGLRRA